jgi:hypothetical protein
MNTQSLYDAIQEGEITIKELRGITDEEMAAGIAAGRKLMESGEHEGAGEILAGMALYDPYSPEVWQALEELARRNCRLEQANFFADIAKIMAMPIELPN